MCLQYIVWTCIEYIDGLVQERRSSIADALICPALTHRYIVRYAYGFVVFALLWLNHESEMDSRELYTDILPDYFTGT